IKPGESIFSALRLAGGFSSVADSTRISVERLVERNGTRVSQVNLPETEAVALARGDVLRVFSVIDAKLPIGRQNKRVVVEGEVLKPGTYVLPANSSVQDALAAAGGFAPNAFIFGTQFTRRSVLLAQQENYDRALRDLETDLTRNATTQRTATADDAKAQDAKSAAATRLVERLRSISPSGRLVFQLEPDATALPALVLEDDDRIYVPARPTSVGVFGSVFNTGSYLYRDERTVGDYMRQAGGTTRGADRESTFVIRANGTVVSALSNAGWLREGSIDTLAALPGDTVFVPEELNKTTFVQSAKDWTQIIYQLGLGAAGINAVR
ncbi:SLBB domain-containing protein, partial [Ideonella sp.]|uniref:SLBB domain-containing protein n=1 Tax=Ideonella sp. TaxID=1929293 RepID=UPI003BB637C4